MKEGTLVFSTRILSPVGTCSLARTLTYWISGPTWSKRCWVTHGTWYIDFKSMRWILHRLRSIVQGRRWEWLHCNYWRCIVSCDGRDFPNWLKVHYYSYQRNLSMRILSRSFQVDWPKGNTSRLQQESHFPIRWHVFQTRQYHFAWRTCHSSSWGTQLWRCDGGGSSLASMRWDWRGRLRYGRARCLFPWIGTALPFGLSTSPCTLPAGGSQWSRCTRSGHRTTRRKPSSWILRSAQSHPISSHEWCILVLGPYWSKP